MPPPPCRRRAGPSVEEPVLPGHVDGQPEQGVPDVECNQAPGDERQAEGVDRGQDVRRDSVRAGTGTCLRSAQSFLRARPSTPSGPSRTVAGTPSDCGRATGTRRRRGSGTTIRSRRRSRSQRRVPRARDAGVDGLGSGVPLPRAVAVEAECRGHSLLHRRHGHSASRGAPDGQGLRGTRSAVPAVVAHRPGRESTRVTARGRSFHPSGSVGVVTRAAGLAA